MANDSFSLDDCQHFIANMELFSSTNSSLGADEISIDPRFQSLLDMCQKLLSFQEPQDQGDPESGESSCSVGFREGYGDIHGYLALCICIVGSLTNILNVVILTRKEMINSTNTILTGLAIVDFLLLVEYIGFAYSYVMGKANFLHYYSHAVYVLFHAHFTQVVHTISICLAITLAVWRYIAICRPHLNLVLCTLPRSRFAVALAYSISFFITLPNYFMYVIAEGTRQDDNSTLYYVTFSKTSESHALLRRSYLIVYGFLIKLLPCILLSFFIYKIIRAMYVAKRRKANLFKMSSSPSSNGPDSARKIPQMERLTEKTTRMLLAVLLMFLIVELPQSVLTLLSAVHGEEFFEQCYMEFGDIMDLMALINSAANFFLYYKMSQQFRLTLRRMLGLEKPRPMLHQGRGLDTAVSTLV